MSHIHEKIDFTVEVFIIFKDKVLLRKHDKYKIWLSIGGHIELDEYPNQAAIREVKEEVGLNIQLYSPKDNYFFQKKNYKELTQPIFMNRQRINNSHEHVTLVYFARAETDNLVLSKTEKTEECKWFTEKELKNPRHQINQNIQVYAQHALKMLNNKNFSLHFQQPKMKELWDNKEDDVWQKIK